VRRSATAGEATGKIGGLFSFITLFTIKKCNKKFHNKSVNSAMKYNKNSDLYIDFNKPKVIMRASNKRLLSVIKN